MTIPSRSNASTISVTERGAKPSNPANVAWFIGPHSLSRINTLARARDKPGRRHRLIHQPM